MNQINQEKSLNILLADDHSLIRQGIFFILEEMEFPFEIFHASNLTDTIQTIKDNHIDFAVIDAHFPDGNSLTIIPEIKAAKPNTKILIFSGIDENKQSLKYIDAGADGFLSKMSEESEVKEALTGMVEKGEYISLETRASLMNSIRNRSIINPLFSLTERELEIANMYADGLGNLEIANKLDVKQNTVSTLKKRIFEKLKIDNIVDLVKLIKDIE